MESKPNNPYRNLDQLQLIGFGSSVVIFGVLLLLKQDTISSFSLSLLLAIFIQLFDLQMRQKTSDERILTANSLNYVLYQDERLYNLIQEIVNDYASIQDIPFDLFKSQATKAITNCRETLHRMARQRVLTAEFGGQYPQGGMLALREAKTSIKIIANEYARYWRNGYPEQFMQLHIEALARGVKITRIFIQSREVLSDLVVEMEKQRHQGIEVRVGFLEDGIPAKLITDGVIFDDYGTTILKLAAGGIPGTEDISIAPATVQERVRDFKTLVDMTKPLDSNLVESLKKLRGTNSQP